MRIDVKIDNSELIRRLENGQRRLAYAVVNAINDTAKRIQRAEVQSLEKRFTVRSDFVRRRVAVIKPFANVRQGRAYAEIAVSAEKAPRLLLSAFERGSERKPFTSGARHVAEPVIGGPARPRFSQIVPPGLRVSKLRFDRTKTGRRRAGVTRTKTYLVPQVGIFQRVARGATRAVYLFTRGKRLEPRLRFVETAQREAGRWFSEEMERQVVEAIGRAKGKGL